MATRKGMMVGRGSGYKNVIPKDPMVHSQSARGMKQPQRVFTPRFFTYQDKNQERIIHSADWDKGNSYRYILEGAGDIFREYTQPQPSRAYLNEKLQRIEDYFDEIERNKVYFPSTGVHPEDSFEYSFANNKDKFRMMVKQWKNQPYKTKEQRLAIELNISMLTKDFVSAKNIIKQLKK